LYSEEYNRMKDKIILDGKSLAENIEQDLKRRVQELKTRTKRVPVLATILVGDNEASVFYVDMKINACNRVGVEGLKVELPEDIDTETLIKKIHELNKDERVHGILLQHPTPKHIDEQKCFDAIALNKDVDGVNAHSFGKMSMGQASFKSASPLAILNLLKSYDIKVDGKEAVIVGKSSILGKPIGMLLLNENATVTICHSQTENLSEIVGRADILVAAIGKPQFIKASWIKPGAVLIDAGYNPGRVGDIELIEAIPKCSAYTPVPGGVGPMTIISLIQQTVEAAEKSYSN